MATPTPRHALRTHNLFQLKHNSSCCNICLHACFAIIYKFVVGVMSRPPYATPPSLLWAWHINNSTHNSLITLFRTFKLIISTGIRIYVSVCACVCVCNCLMSRYCYLPPVHSHPRRGSVHSSHRSQSTRRRLLHSHASPPASLDALPDPSRI